MKLLVTGGCGFLGSNLASYALKNYIKVFIFDNLHRQGAVDNLKWLSSQGDLQFIPGDIRNQNDIFRAIEQVRPDAVFHLSGQVAMTTSIANPRMDFEVNALGTFNLLEAIRTFAPEACVIYSSTNKVYGDLEQYTYEETSTRYVCKDMPEGFNESVQLDFHSPYGCSKGAADQYMMDYARIFGMNTIVFRHSSMYGGRQFATYDQGWVGWFCQQAVNAKRNENAEPFTISGDGKQVRDVLHAEDMIRLYFSALEHKEQARGNAFNIGGGITNSLSLLELFAMLEELLEVKLNYVKLPKRESDQRFFVADIAKARHLLKWEPKVSAIEGIKGMIGWIHEMESR